MPVTLQLDSPHQLVRITLAGDVTDEEVLRLQRALHNTPEVTSAWHALIDCSRTERVLVTTGAMRELGARTRFDASARIAFIAPTDVLFGLARMMEQLHPGPCGIMVFRDRDSAVEWLARERAEG